MYKKLTAKILLTGGKNEYILPNNGHKGQPSPYFFGTIYWRSQTGK